jgi:hypothetical protein
MKHSLILSLALTLSLAAVSPARANDVPGPAGSNCVVYVPDGWKVAAVQKGGEAVMSAASPADDAAFIWMVAEAANADRAIKAVDAQIGKFVTDIKHDKRSKTTLNGMPAIAASGTGMAEGKPVSFGVVIVEPVKGKYLFTIGIVETAKKKQYKPELTKVLAGIRKAS